MKDRLCRSHQQAIGQLFQIGLAATSLRKCTADPYVQEQLLHMVAELDQVIAALHSVTFELVPDSGVPLDLVPDSGVPLDLVPEPPSFEPPAA